MCTEWIFLQRYIDAFNLQTFYKMVYIPFITSTFDHFCLPWFFYLLIFKCICYFCLGIMTVGFYYIVYPFTILPEVF